METAHSPAVTEAVHLEGGVRKYAQPTLRGNLRRWWLARQLGALGSGVHVESNVKFLRHPENVRIGDHVIIKEGARICPANPAAAIGIGAWSTIGYHTFIFASLRIEVGKNCLIAPFCYLVDSNHGIHRGQLIRAQQMTAKPITVGDDVWLGVGVVVLSGVSIGEGAVIGAGTVVNKDIPPYAVVAGNPVQIVAHREYRPEDERS